MYWTISYLFQRSCNSGVSVLVFSCIVLAILLMIIYSQRFGLGLTGTISSEVGKLTALTSLYEDLVLLSVCGLELLGVFVVDVDNSRIC